MAQLVFHLFCENMVFRKDLESPLIFVLFLKGKQNKKEKPQVYLFIWKSKYVKN